MKDKLRSEFQDRQDMILPDYELYYYTDTTLQSVKPHMHGYYEVLFFLEGSVCTWIQGQRYRLKPGDMTLVPPGISHHSAIQPGSEYKRFTLWISASFYQELKSYGPDCCWLPDYAAQTGTYCFHIPPADFPEILSALIRLLECSRGTGFGAQVKSRLACGDLMLNVSRSIHNQLFPPVTKGGQSLFDRLLLYIQAHLEEDLSLDALAAAFYCSKYHLSHLFKENMGVSVHQYVTRKRLEHIRMDLLGDKDLYQAAADMGFHTYSSFYRAFVKEYGISPTEYRQAHLLQPDISSPAPSIAP